MLMIFSPNCCCAAIFRQQLKNSLAFLGQRVDSSLKCFSPQIQSKAIIQFSCTLMKTLVISWRTFDLRCARGVVSSLKPLKLMRQLSNLFLLPNGSCFQPCCLLISFNSACHAKPCSWSTATFIFFRQKSMRNDRNFLLFMCWQVVLTNSRYIYQKLIQIIKPSTFALLILFYSFPILAKQSLPYILIMIRNRYTHFLQQRRQCRPPSQGGQSVSSVPTRPPIWQQDYYHYKSQLSEIGSTNQDIHSLLEHFNVNPSLYNIRALERMLETNCKRINEIQNWVSHFPFSKEPEAAVQLERNMVRYFQSTVLSHINTLFMFRGRLTHLINERNSMENSFSALNNSNISYYSVNKSVHDRGESIREVSAQIQALNSILRRMGDIVASQGDLINRIDQNLNEGVDHISKGRAQLGERLQQQRGEGEFSCSGKINKAIIVLYAINIVLIFILVIKNI